MMRRFTSGPKPSLPGLGVHLLEAAVARGAQAVADAVVAREVRRRLGRRDEVVGADRVARVWQRDLDEPGAELLVPAERVADEPLDAGVDAPLEVLLRDADPQPLGALLQRGEVVVHRARGGGRVARIVPGDGAKQDRRVLDGARHRAHLVERAREGDDAVARHPPVGGLQADDAAEGGRLPDGAAGVGAERGRHLPGRHRRRGAARGAARGPGEVPRVVARL